MLKSNRFCFEQVLQLTLEFLWSQRWVMSSILCSQKNIRDRQIFFPQKPFNAQVSDHANFQKVLFKERKKKHKIETNSLFYYFSLLSNYDIFICPKSNSFFFFFMRYFIQIFCSSPLFSQHTLSTFHVPVILAVLFNIFLRISTFLSLYCTILKLNNAIISYLR